MKLATGDAVRICSREASLWPFNGLTGRVIEHRKNILMMTPEGHSLNCYLVEFVDPKFPGEKQQREFNELELSEWNGVDQMLALLDENENK